ncbi:MAG: c-type cytochrome [Rhodobacterales bacterium]|nr:c-type cytochrome [Rhodobacterales bacterium]
MAPRTAAVAAILALPLALAACLPEAMTPPPSGAQDYATFCAACHGSAGRGDGPAAEGQSPAPADLTGLAARNGGTFPMLSVMGKIYGYAGVPGATPTAGAMPEFGSLLEGQTVLFDAGDGIASPTPLRLVQIAQHLQTLQD